jgi:hypothetical protein
MYRRLGRTWGLLLALGGAACETLPLRVPQLEGATQAAQGGGDRYRDHRSCVRSAESVDGLIGCMQDAGWAFVPPGPLPPEKDCWQARGSGEIDRILPLCFVRGGAQTTGKPPSAPPVDR